MHRRQQSLPVTPLTVPEFIIPDSQHSKRSHTMGAADFSRFSLPFSGRSPGHAQLQNRMKAQSLLLDDKDYLGVGGSFNQSHNSFSSVDSALPVSPKTRYRERLTHSTNLSDPYNNFLAPPMTQRSVSLYGSVMTPLRGSLGSVADRVKSMLPSSPVSFCGKMLPRTARSLTLFSSYRSRSKTTSRAMLRLEYENKYCSSKAPSQVGTCSSLPGNRESGTFGRLRLNLEGSTFSQQQRKLFSSQLTTPYEELDDEVSNKLKPKNSIVVSVTYRPNEKRVVAQVHGLTCMNPQNGCPDDLVAELTLKPGKKRCVLSAPSHDSTGETLPRTALFDGVGSVSLASRRLMIKIYTKGLIRKRGQLLYQASTPFSNLSLTGDANLVSLNPLKALPSITVCMCYRTYKNKLLVTVVKAKDLKKSRISKALYVEVNLLRGSGKQSKMETVRTKARYGGRNPVFKEAFSLELPSKGLASVYTELSFTVRRRNLIRDDEVLGRVTLSSEMLLRWKKSQSLTDTLDEVFRYPGKVITQTHTLCHET